MNRFKLFIENFVVYGLGGIIGKMIPFFMLPIITRIMPNSYYMGINDMSNTILSLAQSFAIMGMYDAMFRMYFEDNSVKYKQAICSSALAFLLFTSFAIFILMFIFRSSLSIGLLGTGKYENLIIITATGVLIGATNSVVAAPTRMENKRKVFLFTNILTQVVSYIIAIVLLNQGHYVYALPIGHMLAALSTEIVFVILNKRFFSFEMIQWKYIKSMLIIGIPLLPNFLIYWIFNSCDRIMISKILGMQFTGIYAVGAKFGQISQLIYSAFAGGWQYFAFTTMNDKDQVELTSKIFEYLGILTLVITILISVFCELFFEILFGKDYLAAAITIPYLFMAPLVQMLFQIAGNQFLVIKKTWPTSLVLCCGAVVNIALNALLIPYMGIEGAAIATLLGYILSVIVITLVLQKMKLFQISKKFLFVCGGYLIYFIMWRLKWREYMAVSLLAALIFILGCILCYKNAIWQLVKLFQRKKLGE